MRDRLILEEELFNILEEKNPDSIKSAKLSILSNSIKIINTVYQEQLQHLKNKNILIKHQASCINIDTDKSGLTPLQLAINNGDVNCVEALIQANANIEFHYNDLTPLMLAAKNGREICVSLLVKAKAKLDVRQMDRYSDKTALMYAAEYGHAGCLQLLLESNANPNLRLKDYPKNDAFLLAVKNGHTECVKLLMEKVNVNQKNEERKHALEISILQKNHDVLRLLAQSSKIDLESKPSWGERPTLLAIYQNNLTALKILLDAKADIQYQSENHTLLTYAVTYERKNIASFLCKAGLDINEKNIKGETALMIAAAWNRDASMINLLCKLGAVVTGDELDTLMHYEFKNTSIKKIAALFQWGISIKNTSRFINFMEKQNKSDPDVIYCLENVYESLKNYPMLQYHGKNYYLLDKSMVEVEYCNAMTNELTARINNAIPFWQLETTQQLIRCSAFKNVSRDVINMIALWDYSIGRTALSHYNTEQDVHSYIKKLEQRIESDEISKKHIQFFISHFNKRKQSPNEMQQENKLCNTAKRR